MKNLKNLDRLFQEKFRDFEQLPPPDVWKNINGALSRKSQKKKPVIWWWMSGVAAGLILFFSLYSRDTTLSVPLDQKTTEINTVEESSQPTQEEETITIQKQNNHLIKNNTEYKKNITLKHKQYPSSRKNTSRNHSKKQGKFIANKWINTTKLRTDSESDELSAEKNRKEEFPEESMRSQDDKEKVYPSQSQQAIAENHDKSGLDLGQEAIDDKHKDEIALLDTKHKESNEEKSDFKTRWHVASQVAPVYFSSFERNGASLNKESVSNTAEGQFSTSYGLEIAYDLNERFTVQIGVNKVDYGYKINNYYVAPEVYADKNSQITMKDIVNTNHITPSFSYGFNQAYQETGRKLDAGSIVQVFGYYELPVAIKYTLLEGNFGIRVLSGMSALIQNKTEIYYQEDNFSQRITDNSTTKNINITGNIGIELNYKVLQNTYVSLTPMFKVYADEFNKDVKNFNPYTLGIYSGLNYRF